MNNFNNSVMLCVLCDSVVKTMFRVLAWRRQSTPGDPDLLLVTS